MKEKRKQGGRSIRKVFILISLLTIITLPIMAKQINKNQQNLKAATAININVGDKVYFGPHVLTALNQGGTSLLSDTLSGSNVEFKNTSTSLISFSNGLGALGKTVSTASVPSYSDLTSVIDGTSLSSNIPTVGSKWWLSDSNNNNRTKFVTDTNVLNGTNTIRNTKMNTNFTCTTTPVTERGVLPTESFKTAEVKKTVITQGTILANSFPNITDQRVYLYKLNDCNTYNGSLQTNGFLGFKGQYTSTGDLVSQKNTAGRNFAGIVGLTDTWKPTKVGDKKTFTINKNQCYNIKSENNNEVYKSIKFFDLKADTLEVTVTVSNVTGTTSSTKTCPGTTNPAGQASTRPKLTINNIAYANNSARTFTPSSTISSSPLDSDYDSSGTAYLTMKASSLTMGLDSSATGVNGTTLSVKRPASGTKVSIPVYAGGTAEGTRYVSAIANDKEGNEVYSVLGELNGTKGAVDLDYSNLIDPTTDTSISLTLFQENSGDYNTAYIGDGTAITINLLEPQDIAFDENNATEMTYGTDLTINAKLTSDTTKQAPTDITFSIKEGSASIVSQSYTASTGVATVTLHPTSGTGSVKVAINKTGNTTYAPAEEQISTITLNKKAITVKPVPQSKTVEDAMPTLTSASNDLVNSDTIPAELQPSLSPIGSAKPYPAVDGKITYAGSWKLVYDANILSTLPKDFTDKYDITLEDYNTDQTLTFDVGEKGIPRGWVIVSPDANDDGWNNSDVTISLSDDAKTAGYTTIEVLDASGNVAKYGSTILYNIETKGETPKVRIKKGDHASDPATLRTIKLDKGDPTISSVTVASENVWTTTSKKVTISASDLISGIKTVSVKCDQTTYTAVKNGNDYQFDADQIGTYTITVTDYAGNTTTTTEAVGKIDATAPTLTATAETLTDPAPVQDIEVSYSVGTSGIKTFKVYYRADSTSTYTFLEDLNTSASPFTYEAELNGWFKFELITQADVKKDAEVEITMINPPVPITKITAVYNDDPTSSYTTDTWTNHDILLSLENINTEITTDVTWEYSVDQGTSWEAMNSDTSKLISTEDTTQVTIQFKASTTIGTDQVTETSAKSFIVKIDKTKPAFPVVNQHENYTNDAWYAEDQTIESTVTPKANGIKQTIYVCEGTRTVCESDTAVWKALPDGNFTTEKDGSHEYYLKTVDAAGNESDLTDAVYVNVDRSEPEITIKLNENELKKLINNLTFGFFYKQTVDVDIEAVFGSGKGDIYYIIDDSNDPVQPTEQDTRWIKGSSTSINHDKKAMIYVKAVSASGIVSLDSSIYNIFVDATDPIIDLPVDMQQYTNENSLSFHVSDALSGIDEAKVKVTIDNDSFKSITLNNGSQTLKDLKDGVYKIKVEASDYSGNTAMKETVVKIDTVAPVISIADQNKNNTIQFTVNDITSGIDASTLKVTDSKNKPVTVTKVNENTYAIKLTISDTYTIHVEDHAGNKTSKDLEVNVKDHEPPVITGAKDKKEYKYYYLPRIIKVHDKGSGVKLSTYQKNQSAAQPFVEKIPLKEPGVYLIHAEDHAGNTASLQFEIVPLPSIDDIDGSDESKKIIEQVERELNEVRDEIDQTDESNYEKWIEDAKKKWEESRRQVIVDDQTTSKVEGQDQTTFDPKTELIVEEIPKDEVPILPKHAIKIYDVYLKKGNTIIQPDGSVKVYLPYDEEEAPIVYEISEDGTVREITSKKENGYVSFVTNTLKKYAISNIAQEDTKKDVCVAGPDGELGTSDDVCGEGNGTNDANKGDDGSVTVPDGGSVIFPDGNEVELPDGGIIKPDGSVTTPDGNYDKDGNFTPNKKCPTEGKEINVDSNKDGKPDLNIDTDGDCKADLNIDTDGDGIPNVNIDTTLDGKPDYNIDLNNDGKPDVNIGPVNDPWKPSVCKTVGKLEYCSDPYKKPYLNVDTDGDGRPDLNLDLDGDLEADLNIDVDGDNIPDVNIDTTGDGKPDINIDIDNDGEADENLLKLTKWEPNKDVDGKIKYDTMSGLVPDPELNKNPNSGNSSSGTDAGGVNSSTKVNGTFSNVNTGDVVKTSFWWILVLINGCVTGYLMHRRRKQKR